VDARDVVGRVLVLLADIALIADSNVARASELADEALDVLPDDELVGLHDARSVHSAIAWWLGDAAASRLHAEATIDIARAMKRRDLESLALSHLTRLANVEENREQARELAQRALELAEESGSREAFAFARAATGGCAKEADDIDGAERAYREALAAYEEIGAAGRVGWMQTMLATVELQRGDVGAAEKLLREAVSRLHAAQDTGFLVEAERQLAETLVHAGKIDEAARVAEHARRTVGREDVWSRASTLHALGIVRAAQRRTDEAEALLQEALAIVEPTMYRNLSDEVRASLAALRTAPAGVRVR
jgi:tetratricopeptide (TPR) repeat protein